MFLPILVVAESIPAQDRPAVSTGEIRFYVDHANFRGAAGKSYVEFYQMLYADQLRHVINDGNRVAVFRNAVTLKDDQQNEIRRREWTTEASIVLDSTGLNALAIYDQWAEELVPGSYWLEVEAADAHSASKGYSIFAFEVLPMADETFCASQIEFAVQVQDGGTDTRFVKNRRTIVPNPSRRYGVLNPMLYVYYEVYNLPEIGENQLAATYSLRDQNGAVVKAFPSIAIQKPGAAAGVAHGVNLATVPSGVYELIVQIADSMQSEQLQFSRQFEVIQLDYLAGPGLTKGQSEQAGRLLKYVATPEEYQFFQSLNAFGKAQFLIRFWRDRDVEE